MLSSVIKELDGYTYFKCQNNHDSPKSDSYLTSIRLNKNMKKYYLIIDKYQYKNMRWSDEIIIK